ncbi:g202 [Coccomyxa elongata]
MYRDTIIFFKVGKFYELYEDDAEIGAQTLGWKMTITGVGHCRQVGCPESGVEEAVARLVTAGYKVARMEQMETAQEAKAARGPKATIRRQLTRVHTPATATGNVSVEAVHLMALHEAPMDSHATACQESRVAPRELLVRRNELSAITQRALMTHNLAMEITNVSAAEFPDPHVFASGDRFQEIFKELIVPHNIQAMGAGAMAALSALCLYLKRANADKELATHAQKVVSYKTYAGALCLDGPTLTNLELLENTTGGTEGSLLARLDTCASPGGRRLLRLWLCRPLRDVGAIEQRLDAVSEIGQRPSLVAPLRAALHAMPDLDRALGRVRNAAAAPQQGLPTWALEAAQKRRLVALDTAVTAVAKAMSTLREFQSGRHDSNRPLSTTLLATAAASAPDEHSPAVKTLMDIDETLVSSDEPAKGSKTKGKGKAGHRSVCVHPEALRSTQEQSASESQNDTLDREIAVTTLLIEKFNAHSSVWEGMEEALSILDVLTAFAAFTETSSGEFCRPTVLPPASNSGTGAMLDLRGLWHPCAVPGGGDGTCIVANDLVLGGREPDSARTLLLTGPNMGGKSTILRAASTACILAQMGCPVPAASATLTMVDRIFTRLGAQDRIMAGQSTFLVECTEAAAILQHATPHSLVICDELGRGTSTFDGYAIAHAVLKHLSSSVDCRLLFATHYHPLTMEFLGSPRVKLGHMAALVSGDDAASDGHITFLYKLLSGACPKSYGLQVARLAGIPHEIINVAQQAGMKLEETLQGAFSKKLRMPLRTEELDFLHDIVRASSIGPVEKLMEAWMSCGKDTS